MFEDDEEEGDEDAEDGDDQDDDGQHTPVFTPGSESAASGSLARRHRGRVLSGRFGPMAHRFSMSRKFSTSSGQVPAIFSNTGLSEPPAISLDQQNSSQDPFFPSPAPGRVAPSGLGAIAEGSQVNETSPLVSPTAGVVEQPQVTSTWKALPLLMILEVSSYSRSSICIAHTVQYGLLAFHNTTHDQIYLSFLVT